MKTCTFNKSTAIPKCEWILPWKVLSWVVLCFYQYRAAQRRQKITFIVFLLIFWTCFQHRFFWVSDITICWDLLPMQCVYSQRISYDITSNFGNSNKILFSTYRNVMLIKIIFQSDTFEQFYHDVNHRGWEGVLLSNVRRTNIIKLFLLRKYKYLKSP